MTELQELIENKTLQQLFVELKFQLKNGEYLGGTICSHIVAEIESKGGKILRKADYDKIHNDYKGTWSREDVPEYVGKRTAMLGECKLSIEDYHFIII